MINNEAAGNYNLIISFLNICLEISANSNSEYNSADKLSNKFRVIKLTLN